MAALQPPDPPKSRRRVLLDKGLPPVERLKGGVAPWAMIDVREAEAIANLRPGARCSHAWTVLAWLKLLAEGKAEAREKVQVSDLTIATRAHLSPNTVAKAIAALCAAGLLLEVKRRRGAKPVYRFAYPPAAIGSGGKRSSENGELSGDSGQASSPESEAQFPTDWGTVPQNLSTRSPNSEQGTERRAAKRCVAPLSEPPVSVNEGSLSAEGEQTLSEPPVSEEQIAALPERWQRFFRKVSERSEAKGLQ